MPSPHDKFLIDRISPEKAQEVQSVRQDFSHFSMQERNKTQVMLEYLKKKPQSAKKDTQAGAPRYTTAKITKA